MPPALAPPDLLRFDAVRLAVDVNQLRAAESKVRRDPLVVLFDQLEILVAELFDRYNVLRLLLLLRECRVNFFEKFQTALDKTTLVN